MRIAFHSVSVALAAAAIVACADTNSETFNPITPDLTKARIRIFNATNTNVNMAANGETATALNSNIAYGVSRCFNVSPATPGLSVIQTVSTAAIPIPASITFEAGKNYTMVLYNPTTTATNFAFASWDNDDAAFTPHADSSGLRAFNAAPTAGALDLYVNAPAVAPATEPALTATIRRTTNLPVGSLGASFNTKAGAAYQYRVTRTGVTTGTSLINTTNTLVAGEEATVILGLPATGTTTVRASTTQGC